VAAAVRSAQRSPVDVELAGLIRLKAAGETIRLSTPRVRATAIGGHLSPFKGRGVEFDESRPYQAGDDLRTIDWRVTARTGKPHTKVFREERNRPVFLWLDVGAPMRFATQGAFKSVVAAEAAALLAWSAVGNGDQLGGLIFSDDRHEELRPRLGRRSALRLLSLIEQASDWEYAETAVSGAAGRALQRLTRVARPGSMLFLLSDFTFVDDDAERHVRQLAARSDVFLVHLYDPVDAELPPPGRYRIQVGQQTFSAKRNRLRALARMPGVRLIECATNEDPYRVLLQNFAKA
jgi:uncharacterized protein (DUF58 family)